METLISINSAINNFVWGIPAMVCILGIGLYLSIRTGFIQIRKFGLAMKETFGKIFTKGEKKEGAITPFQALCTALAATVGARSAPELSVSVSAIHSPFSYTAATISVPLVIII